MRGPVPLRFTNEAPRGIAAGAIKPTYPARQLARGFLRVVSPCAINPTIAILFRCGLALLAGLRPLPASAPERAGPRTKSIQADRDPVFPRPSDRCGRRALRIWRAPTACWQRSEGLAVTTDIAAGSPEAIARVAAGTSDFALVDINALIRFRDKPSAPPVKAVFVLFNQAPYAIVARKSRGIRALSDIEGKTLGVAEGDLSIRLWPALARQNGIKKRQRQAEQHERRRARADAVGGPGRCGDRVFLSVGGQFAGPRRSGRRPRGAPLRRLWLRGLRLRGDRQPGIRSRATPRR